MATRKAASAPRTGQWTGTYIGTDLETRAVYLAMNRRGTRLTGRLTIVFDAATGESGVAAFTGTYTAGKVNLTVTIPRGRLRQRSTMKVTGRLVALEDGGQAIVATTTPGRGDQGATLNETPLDGVLALRTTDEEPEMPSFAEEDGGAWVDPGGEK